MNDARQIWHCSSREVSPWCTPTLCLKKYDDGCGIAEAKDMDHIPLHSVLLHSASAGFLKVQAKTLGKFSHVQAC